MDNKVGNKGMKKFLLINCHACDLMQEVPMSVFIKLKIERYVQRFVQIISDTKKIEVSAISDFFSDARREN